MIDPVLLLTIAGTVIALYQILPETKQVRISYAIGKNQLLGIFLILIGVVALSLVSATSFLKIPEDLIRFCNFTPATSFIFELVQLIALFGILAIIFVIFFKTTVPIANKENFIEILENFWLENKYVAFFSVIEENYTELFIPETKMNLLEGDPFLDYFKAKLSDDAFIVKLVLFKPYLGLKICLDPQLESDFKELFIDQFFKELIRNGTSILYHEMNVCQNIVMDTHRRYTIEGRNKILHSLFSDLQVAYALSIWKPIGEFVMTVFDTKYSQRFDDYNEYRANLQPDFHSNLKDPAFCGIRFFDIMVTEAIYKRFQSHFWLYYYQYFVDKICRNYQINDTGDPAATFPNYYAVLLNRIIYNMEDWIRLIESDTRNVSQPVTNLTSHGDEHNIIKHAIICFAHCIGTMLRSRNLSPRLKFDFFAVYMRLYFDLAKSTDELVRRYAEIMNYCLLENIQSNWQNADYRLSIIQAWDCFDKIPMQLDTVGHPILDTFEHQFHEALHI